MRRIAALASLATLLIVLLPGAVTAAPATKTVRDVVFVDCETTTDDGYVSAIIVIGGDPEVDFADFTFWANGLEPFVDQPTLYTGDVTFSGDATHLSADFDLLTFDATQTPPDVPAGTASFEAGLSPSGDPEPFDERQRDGNHWFRGSGTRTPLAADGSLVWPGAELTDLSTCIAGRDQFQTFATNPSSFTDGFRNQFVSCDWDIDAESFVHLSIGSDTFGTFGDVGIFGPDMDIFGGNDATLTDTSAALDVILTDGATNEEVGSASATATLASTGVRERHVEAGGRGPSKTFDATFSVDGALDVTIDGVTTTYPMDADHCLAADRRVIVHNVSPDGPKPGPIANDTPDTAIAARLGRAVRLVTGGNAPDAEAPCSTIYPGDDHDSPVPMGYTAWYTVTGTGNAMTVDTTKSDFDTVAAVYTSGPGGLEQVVCVDDVGEPDFQLQAKATWASVAGTTYYLQLGGFDRSAGHLEFTVK